MDASEAEAQLKKLPGSRYIQPWNAKLTVEILDDLPYYDLNEALNFYGKMKDEGDNWSAAFLGCMDRFYLLTTLLNRHDLVHPWLFDRCREVETRPDGHIDLWARYHGKTSVITIGGVIQEILRDPNITIAIFSATKSLSSEILGQIKNEFETNEVLKSLYSDILYENPRGKNPETGERPAKWSLARGLTVKRTQRPKEASLEAHGLIDGQPTGRHFHMHVYDDVVTQDNLSEDQLKKTTARFEMADNLGTRHGVRKWICGTRYSFADTYGTIIDRRSAIPRIYPATDDGTLNGRLVLLSPAHWEKIKRDQGMKIVSAQMLLNPIAGNEATFQSLWLKGYDIVPRVLNVYILVDPSKGSGERSDRTAIAVIGIDPAGNKYLLGGVCHRMSLSERYDLIVRFKDYWEGVPGVQMVRVGYERYGASVEVEVIKERLLAANNSFPIEELNTPRQGGHSKNDRISRLEPDIRGGRFYLPAVVHHGEFGPKTGEFAGSCYWSVWSEEDTKTAQRLNQQARHHLGQIIYREVKGLTRAQQQFADTKYRIVRPLKRLDENKDVYDLTRVFIEEMVRHPFAVHDDLIDAVSRIYDIDPKPPTPVDSRATESIDVDDRGNDHAAGDYDDA
jgi:hypothetical protein